MMRLLRSWRDSLLLLAPQNFKLFTLVTLKSTFETYKALVCNVWYFWALPVFFLIQIYFDKAELETRYFAKLSLSNYVVSGALLLFTAIWMTVVFCLATRPSIGKKTLHYFNAHGRFTLILAFVAIALWQLGFWSNWFFSYLRYELTSAAIMVQSLGVLILADFIPLWIFFILFFLDSDGSITELWNAVVRAVKMTLYNLPLLLILMIVTVLPVFVLAKFILSWQWPAYIAPLLYIVLLKPFIINIWTNIYIKKFHEMPELYFKQPN